MPQPQRINEPEYELRPVIRPRVYKREEVWYVDLNDVRRQVTDWLAARDIRVPEGVIKNG